VFDICIIGAGIVGSAIAKELSKYQLHICWLEKGEDVSVGTTKANSGIIHGGYAAKHGTLKAKLCRRGNELYRQWVNDLHFPLDMIGAFVIGFNDEDKAVLQKLYENGIKNGVKDLQIVDGDFVRQKEPHLNPDITCALYVPSVGITSPYELAIALAENAITNGVELRLNSEVVAIEKEKDHFNITTHYTPLSVHFDYPKNIKAKMVINAAGLHADDVAQLVGLHDFKIHPRKGQYLLFDKDQGPLVNSVVFQTPTPISKGILVTPTYHRNLLIGPDAQDVLEKQDLATDASNLARVVETAKKTLSTFDLRKVITSFAGNRAASDRGDFIIEESKVDGFINVAGIESPGLTAAPAIAEYVIDILRNKGLAFTEKSDFKAHRKPYHHVALMNKEALNALIKESPNYGRIVCRCETVSEGEIDEALKRPVPIDTFDAIKRRTRAGMGRCQAGFCTPRILEILFDQLHMPIETISKNVKGSEIVIGRTKRALEEEK